MIEFVSVSTGVEHTSWGGRRVRGDDQMVLMEISSGARMAGTGAGATGAKTGGLRETEGSWGVMTIWSYIQS